MMFFDAALLVSGLALEIEVQCGASNFHFVQEIALVLQQVHMHMGDSMVGRAWQTWKFRTNPLRQKVPVLCIDSLQSEPSCQQGNTSLFICLQEPLDKSWQGKR